jgi:hypothetical protein
MILPLLAIILSWWRPFAGGISVVLLSIYWIIGGVISIVQHGEFIEYHEDYMELLMWDWLAISLFIFFFILLISGLLHVHIGWLKNKIRPFNTQRPKEWLLVCGVLIFAIIATISFLIGRVHLGFTPGVGGSPYWEFNLFLWLPFGIIDTGRTYGINPYRTTGQMPWDFPREIGTIVIQYILTIVWWIVLTAVIVAFIHFMYQRYKREYAKLSDTDYYKKTP